MMPAYFFSGFDPSTGFTSEIAANLRKDITNRDLLLFIASSPSGHEKTDRYLNGTRNWFEQSGIFFKDYLLLDDSVDNAKAQELINSASCIYLMGGDTLAQISFLKNNSLIGTIINSKAVVIGLSAGAINMSKTSLCSKDAQVPETVIYDGIGIADITIEPHFSPDNSELISELKFISLQHLIYAMCDNSAVIVRDESISLIGEIYQIHNVSMEQISI